jgi:muconolactone delta-isomerase
MPQRLWRDDQATPLSPHPNDPVPPTARRHGAPEFLTTFTLVVRDGDDPAEVARGLEAEAHRTRELAGRGVLARLWRLPAEGHALGLWQVDDAERLRTILDALPLRRWLETETVPLSEHPNDPARNAG